MALYYLSGDNGMTKKKKKSSSDKSEKKDKRKKKVAKIGLVESRAAFLAIVNLNALKIANKLARICKTDEGKKSLRAKWEKFGGNFDKLTKAISKGAKETVGDDIGVAVEVAIATALPIVIAMAPLIKQFKAGGNSDEQKEFDQGVNDGKKTLNDSDEFDKGTADMPEDQDVGRSKKDKSGDKGDGQASFFSPVGLIFKIGFLYAMLKANGIDIFFWLG